MQAKCNGCENYQALASISRQLVIAGAIRGAILTSNKVSMWAPLWWVFKLNLFIWSNQDYILIYLSIQYWRLWHIYRYYISNTIKITMHTSHYCVLTYSVLLVTKSQDCLRVLSKFWLKVKGWWQKYPKKVTTIVYFHLSFFLCNKGKSCQDWIPFCSGLRFTKINALQS